MTDKTGSTNSEIKSHSRSSASQLGAKLFELRDFTPIPLVLVLLLLGEPSARTATIGTMLIVAGELFRIYSVAFIGGVSRTRSRATGSGIITAGPYAYVRNPLYVGNLLICVGFAIYSGLFWLLLLTIALFSFQYYYIVAFEESVLHEKFGDEFDSYRSNVPAWIPTKFPRSLEEIEWPESFAAAILSEKRTLSAISVLLLVLVLLG